MLTLNSLHKAQSGDSLITMMDHNNLYQNDNTASGLISHSDDNTDVIEINLQRNDQYSHVSLNVDRKNRSNIEVSNANPTKWCFSNTNLSPNKALSNSLFLS